MSEFARAIVLAFMTPDNPGVCALCSEEVLQRRPYGPNGAEICQPCGDKDPVNTFKRTMNRLIDRDPTPKEVENYLRIKNMKEN
jgi:hypothetical protein